MRLEYRAWLRDNMGRDSDTIALPTEIQTVGRLLDWLPTQGERFERAFNYIDVVLVSVNRQHAGRDHPVHDEDEVILAPPVAGG